MFFYEGFTCPVCNTFFQENDDIVSCPHCGLPHHRACWRQEGHCHLEQLHGTDEQWTRVEAEQAPANSAQTPQTKEYSPMDEEQRVCPRCHTINPQFAEFCKRCGQALPTEDWHSETHHTPPDAAYSPFRSPFGYQSAAYSQSEQIGNHSAAEWEAIVGNNAAYYVPRFRRIENGGACGSFCTLLAVVQKAVFLGLFILLLPNHLFFCIQLCAFPHAIRLHHISNAGKL